MEDITDMYVPIANCPECGNSMIFRQSDLSESKPLSYPGCEFDIDRDSDCFVSAKFGQMRAFLKLQIMCNFGQATNCIFP